MNPSVFDMAAHEAKLDRFIAQSFCASFMSNSKWRRAFSVLASPDLQLSQLVWKFVGRDIAIRGAIPDSDCLGEVYVRDVGLSAFPYKKIEWIEVPFVSVPRGSESIPFKHKPQDAEQAQRALEAIGEFETALLPDGLRLYGYR